MSGVSFVPPLWLQRQAWVLAQLSSNRSQSIWEIGCSTAPLLQAVLPPPIYLYPDAEWREKVKRATKLARHSIFDAGPIAPHQMTIMDIDIDALQEPIALLQKESASSKPSQRWHDLHVKVLCASLVENLKNKIGQVDVAVATEVIEHLEASILDQFASSVLGNHRPKVLLLTTPNYDFNIRFEDEGRFPDPTGRTNRFFRHDDHKFEWTVEEFSQWCQEAADCHGYTVVTGGVGQDDSSRDDALFSEASRYATQTAIFIRQDCRQESIAEIPDMQYPLSKLPSDDSDYSLISHDDGSSFKSIESASVTSDGFEIVKETSTSAATTALASSSPANSTLDLDFFLHADTMLPKQEDPEEEKQSIVDLTFNIILDIGQAVEAQNEELKEGKTCEAELWLVWMCEDIRWCCQGRLDYWLNAIGLTFAEDGFTCNDDITLLVKESDLFLSIKILEDDKTVEEIIPPQD